jgi:hypothetical protein
MKFNTRNCCICGKEFPPTNGRQATCNDICKRKRIAQRQADYGKRGLVRDRVVKSYSKDDFPEFYNLIGCVEFGKRKPRRCLKCGIIQSMPNGSRICYPCSVKNSVFGVLAG